MFDLTKHGTYNTVGCIIALMCIVRCALLNKMHAVDPKIHEFQTYSGLIRNPHRML